MGYNCWIMLKILTVLVLLTVWLPVHGEQKTPQSGSDKKVSDEAKKPTPPSSRIVTCVIQQPGTTVQCNWPTDNPPSYLSRLISAENLPNLLLFFVGLGGIRIAVCTLGILKRQTKATEDAAKGALDAARAALEQIELVKDKERAQLSIEFDELDLTYDRKLEGYPIRFNVVLDGSTRAVILQQSIVTYLAETAGTKRISWEPLGIPDTFRPELSPFPCVTVIQTDDDIPDNERDSERIDLVRQSELDVYVTGKILYRDLFGDEWELGIDKIWHQWASYTTEGGNRGAWGAAGNGKGDYHRKANQTQNPNWDTTLFQIES